MVVHCCVFGCNNRKIKGSTLSFHTFPIKDPEKKQQWIKNISRADVKGKPWQPTFYDRVCSEHFKPDDYKEGKLIKCLKDNAVPILFSNYPLHKQIPRSRKRLPPKQRPSVSAELPFLSKYYHGDDHSYSHPSVGEHLKKTEKKLSETEKVKFIMSLVKTEKDAFDFEKGLPEAANGDAEMLQCVDEDVKPFGLHQTFDIRSTSSSQDVSIDATSGSETREDEETIDFRENPFSDVDVKPLASFHKQDASLPGESAGVNNPSDLAVVKEEILYSDDDVDSFGQNKIRLVTSSKQNEGLNKASGTDTWTGSESFDDAEISEYKYLPPRDLQLATEQSPVSLNETARESWPQNVIKMEPPNQVDSSSRPYPVAIFASAALLRNSRKKKQEKNIAGRSLRSDSDIPSDPIVIHSSVDHIVSGNDVLENDIADKPVCRDDSDIPFVKIEATDDGSDSDTTDTDYFHTPMGTNRGKNKSFKCLHCPKTFPQSGVFNTHMRTHTGERPFICKQCDRSFSQKGNLHSHMRTHSGEKPFKCQQCDKSFTQKGSLQRHVRTHTGEKPYQCTVCHRSFSQTSSLQTHMKKHSNFQPNLGDEDTEKLYKCNICHETFIKNSHLQSHKRTHPIEKLFKCDKCYKSFAQIIHLQAHMRTHSGKKPFKCSHCNKSFSKSSHLKAHIRTHTGERPFKCDQCGKCFIQRGNLQLHMSTYHEKDEIQVDFKPSNFHFI